MFSRMYSPFAGLGEQIISRQCGPFIFSKNPIPFALPSNTRISWARYIYNVMLGGAINIKK